MPLPRCSAAVLPSAAAHLAWMCIVAGVFMCKDGIVMITRCSAGTSPRSACVQYSIGHSSLSVASSHIGTPLPLLSSSASWQVPLHPSAPNRLKPSNIVKQLNLMRRQLSCDFAASNCDAPQCLKQEDRNLFLAHVVLSASASPSCAPRINSCQCRRRRATHTGSRVLHPVLQRHSVSL
jgi:hypothetical protein